MENACLASAARNDAELGAWLDGSWDIVAGGMFDDVWRPQWNLLPDFPANLINLEWVVKQAAACVSVAELALVPLALTARMRT